MNELFLIVFGVIKMERQKHYTLDIVKRSNSYKLRGSSFPSGDKCGTDGQNLGYFYQNL